MTTPFTVARSSGDHQPVMRDEVLDGLAVRGDGWYFDCTFGRGGHSGAILERLSAGGRLFAIDRDPEATAAAHTFQADRRFQFNPGRFSRLGEFARDAGIWGRLDGILFDLGVSSPQFDDPQRGFSFSHDGPLDMRMTDTDGWTAATWLARTAECDMARCLREFGEERYARRIARAIVAARRRQSIQTTRQLVAIIEQAVPRSPRGIHVATRTFQAIRIAVNDELSELATALPQATGALAPAGRLVVISFHSLEDRIVKRYMRDEARGATAAAATVAVGPARLRVIGRPRRASAAEVHANRRARSAIMRVAEKVA